MVRFQTIPHHIFIDLDKKKWLDVPTKEIVDKTGKSASRSYAGRRYRLIVRERTFSLPIYIGRCLLGIVAVICTLGIVLFSESVRNLFHKKLIKHFGTPVVRRYRDSEPQLHIGRANKGALPEALGLKIFSYLGGPELAKCCLVSRNFARLTSRSMVWECAIAIKAIGKDVWPFLNEVNIKGKIGIGVVQPSLPPNIYEWLCSPSPSTTNKTFGETHQLVLFPNILNNREIINRDFVIALDQLGFIINGREFNKSDLNIKSMFPVAKIPGFDGFMWILVKR